MIDWPKKITEWQDGNTLYLSVPFTWLLAEARSRVVQGDFFAHTVVVGGPAVKLLPSAFYGTRASIADEMPGVLQRVNPEATRTTTGCPCRCEFCGIGRRLIEGDFTELPDWPDLPVLCDNNLLASSRPHFDRVIDRLVRWGWCDFNQGLDARLLTDHHAKRIAEIGKPMVRLALDSDATRDTWARAVDRLRDAGNAKSRIRSYVLCGFGGSTHDDDWRRCEYVKSFGLDVLPMWFHRLDATTANNVTPEQELLGWTHDRRIALMRWYYKRVGPKPILADPPQPHPEP